MVPSSYYLSSSFVDEHTASQRLRVANAYKADAEKILLVKAAEADMESKHLTGVGIAKQRKALVDGLQDTVSEFSASVLFFLSPPSLSSSLGGRDHRKRCHGSLTVDSIL